MKNIYSKVGMLTIIGALSMATAIPAFAQIGVSVNASVDATAATGVSARAVATSTLRVNIKDQVIARATERGDQEVVRRMNALTNLNDRINAMIRISGDEKMRLSASIKEHLDDMAELQAKIKADAEANATTSLKADVQSITASYRIFALIMPQANIRAAADRALDITAAMKTLGTKLQTRISEAQSAGKDVSAMTTAYADFTAKIADAEVQANAAISGTASLTPDNGDKAKMEANLKALKDARAKIQAAQQDLVAARKDAGTITRVLATLNVGATTTVNQ